MSIKDHLGAPNILGSLRNLSEYMFGGLTRPRSITFAFVTSIFDICMYSELYSQDFCVVFSWVKSFGLPFTF